MRIFMAGEVALTRLSPFSGMYVHTCTYMYIHVHVLLPTCRNYQSCIFMAGDGTD